MPTAMREKPDGYPDTPNLDKMVEVGDTSQVVGQFIDWLGTEKGGHLFIGEWRHQTDCTHTTPKGRFSLTEIARCRDGIMVATEDHPTEEEGYELDECPACHGTGFVDLTNPIAQVHNESIERILSRFFGVDRDAAERERMAVLRWVQEQA